MDILLDRFNAVVNGVIKGFDRIVFKGMLRTLMFAGGMQLFLMRRGVLNKDFKDYAMAQSKIIIESAEKTAKDQCGSGIAYIPSSKERKEDMAHAEQERTGKKEGLIGVWSCVEACNTYRSAFNPAEKYPTLDFYQSRCKHLYFYYDDPDFGFMSIRIQTWAPYEVQIALNGREWLRRSLDARGCGYIRSGNKFLRIDDYALAQELLYRQFEIDFNAALDRFLPLAVPRMQEATGGMPYYWTVWQSEVAKDYVFSSADALDPLMDDLLRHALMTGTGNRILRYFGRPVKPDGQPMPNTDPEIMSRASQWFDGIRVRHWNDKNSVKLYNEHNVLRFEMTMNDPTRFKIHRHSECQDVSEPKKFLPMRKGIADINVRAKVSCDIVDRFTDHMATVETKEQLGCLLESICKPLFHDGRRTRALDAFGKDLALIRAIADPAFDVTAITNKQLQSKLGHTPWANGMSGKQLSGRISRHLLLLREHGLIKKLPKQRKYALTDKGKYITTAVIAALSVSVDDLVKLSA